jgi:class 3 adenylate cyclase/tetratricopeptide (TPR) repeat protein
MQICPGCGEENPDKFRVCGFCGTALATVEPQPAEPETTVCPSCGEANPAKFRLCGFCGAELAPPAPPQDVRKLVTILFCDLKGSTSLGERLDSESLREVMTRYFDAMSASITQHGGTIEKFIGDAVMAVFGLPRVHEDDALRAVRAARGMQDALGALNEGLERTYGVSLENRIGVNTGEVVAGDAATGQRLVTGDPVNTAARLEQAAGACEVLLGELTYRLVRDYVQVEPVEPLELKGKAERVPAFRLLEVHERAAEAAHRPPLVGREPEVTAVADALAHAMDSRKCARLLITGDAGVGKSRLVEHVCEAASERGLVIRGRCLSYGDGITFWPLVEALRSASGIEDSDDRAAARSKLASLLGPENEDVFERLASAVGLSEEQYSLAEVFWASRKLVEILSRRRPLILVLEDLHWAEPALLDLVDHIVAGAEDAPALVLCVARPDLLETRSQWADLQRLDLTPLSAEAAARVIDNLLGEANIAEDARTRIVEAADGNPLFVEQLLSMMIDEQLLRLEEGTWLLGELPPGWVPPTIHALLTARLDGLEREQRAVIDPASVIGQYFQQEALRELVDDFVSEQVDRRLSELTRKQLVLHADSAFRFQHILIRDSVYEGLLKRARATLHERFVAWGDRVNGDRATEFEEISGYHLEQAHRNLVELGIVDEHTLAVGAEAARRLGSAGRRAFVRGDMSAAANLLLRATSPLPPQSPQRLSLFPDLGEALMQLGEFEHAESLLEDAAATAELAGEHALAANARLVRLFVLLLAGETEDWTEQATRAAEAAILLCEGEGDEVGLARAWRLTGWSSLNACHYEASATALGRAIEHARRAGDVRQERRASTQFCWTAVWGPMPVGECIARCEEIAARVVGDRQAEAAVVCILGQLEAMRGRFEPARELIRRALAMFEELGLVVDAATVAQSAGRVELLAGDAPAAEAALRRGYDYFASVGERYLQSSLAGLLAEAVFIQGRWDDAEALAAETEELAAADDVDAQMLWRLQRARLLTVRGDVADAERLAREAADLLEPTDDVVSKITVLATLAAILRLAGNAAEADDRLSQARKLADAKGSPLLLEQVPGLAADVPASPRTELTESV